MPIKHKASKKYKIIYALNGLFFPEDLPVGSATSAMPPISEDISLEDTKVQMYKSSFGRKIAELFNKFNN